MILVELGKRARKLSTDMNGVNVLPELKPSEGAKAMMAWVTDDSKSDEGRLV